MMRGFLGLLRGKPVHPVGPDGRMQLSDHFREVRARLLRIVLLCVVVFIVALFQFDLLNDIVYGPYHEVLAVLPEGTSMQTTSGAGGGLMLYLRLAAFATVVVTAPYWLYQVWAFLLPGLHAHERRWSLVFAAIAGPLFIIGVVLGYVTFPKALEILIGFNPPSVVNLVESSEYLTLFTRTMLVFGIAFEIPVFVVLLNFAGVVKGKQLAQYRAWIIVGTFVFAAVATPSADPFTMTFMAVPMVLLFFVSEVIARVNDRRREARKPNAGLSPDEASVV
ncbi:MAG: twin-arginine translocase subunit TatC [Nocardioides sp.]|uniref:twin-arginine translocase subunit TatC n=1 Tax=Nocardioides sp. TaxID=35761 RepID=UPI003EFD6C78